MKYAKTAWLAVQGLALLAVLSYGLLLIKRHFVEGSHAMPQFVFEVILIAALGGGYGFAAQRVLKEIRRVRHSDGGR